MTDDEDKINLIPTHENANFIMKHYSFLSMDNMAEVMKDVYPDLTDNEIKEHLENAKNRK